MRIKKPGFLIRRALRRAIKQIWTTFEEEANQAWVDYGQANEPATIAHQVLLERVELACARAMDQIDQARKEAHHEN